MVLLCGLQEKTLLQNEASLEHKQMLLLHYDAEPAWTPGRDPPSSATHRLQEHPSFPVCMEQCPSLAHSTGLAGTPRHCQVVVGCLFSHRLPMGQCGSTHWGRCCALLYIKVLSPISSRDQKQILIALSMLLEEVFSLTFHFLNGFLCIFSTGAEIWQLGFYCLIL